MPPPRQVLSPTVLSVVATRVMPVRVVKEFPSMCVPLAVWIWRPVDFSDMALSAKVNPEWPLQ